MDVKKADIEEPPPKPMDGSQLSQSTARFASTYGTAIGVTQVGQVVWLVAGSRVLSATEFGTVLAAQALYGVLQFLVDNGPAWFGARVAATGRLDAAYRNTLIRMRLELFVVAALVAAVYISLAGDRAFAATAPYIAALGLFALLNVWERFGHGDSVPWSTYLTLRGVGPAVFAVAFLIAGGDLPLWLVGTVECASIL